MYWHKSQFQDTHQFRNIYVVKHIRLFLLTLKQYIHCQY